MSFENVDKFFDYTRKKGIVASNTVNGWSGALSALDGVLDDDEKNINFILENEDVIRNRLQNQNHEISGGTLNIYIQRSKRALNAFAEWNEDRAAWEKKMASTKSKPTGANKSKKAKTKKASSENEKVTSESRISDTDKKVFPIPTSSGDSFDVALPKSYTMDDLPRVIWALAVYAEDFNPSEVLRRYGNPPLKNDNDGTDKDLPAIQ